LFDDTPTKRGHSSDPGVGAWLATRHVGRGRIEVGEDGILVCEH
jgi:hypothetical protein